MHRASFVRSLGLVSTLSFLGASAACGGSRTSSPDAREEGFVFGASIVRGDLDGDGVEDVAITAPDVDGTSRVLLHRSGAGRRIDAFSAPSAVDARSFGDGLAFADSDGDGRLELLVGAGRTSTVAFRVETDGLDARTFAGRHPALPSGLPSGAVRPSDVAAALPTAVPPTPLQQHVQFFDRNGNGVITPAETYAGLRAIGVDFLSSGPIALAIHLFLGPATSGLSLDITIATIDFGKHGSDSEIYDDNGYFRADRFEEFFQKWDINGDGALDPFELTARTLREADLFDFLGVAASAGEFGLLWLVANENGRLSKDRLRAQYDGTLFYILEAERRHP